MKSPYTCLAGSRLGVGVLGCVLLLAVLPVDQTARADPYPEKPIRLIVPYPAGGGTDIAARWISEHLSERLKQPVIVDNRAGANGNVGTDVIAKAAPDGYTIGMATPGPVTVGRSLYPRLPYDPLKDLTPIILANASPIVLVVNSDVPAKTVAELVGAAQRSPGKFTAAIVSIGSVPHLLTELFKKSAGIEILDVPYKGGNPAAVDVMAGQVNMMFSVLPLVLPYITAGKLRPLAIASESRSLLVPDVPTFIETGYPQVVGSAWNGIVAPAGLPVNIVNALSANIAEILRTTDTRERFKALGMEPGDDTPAAFASFLKSESDKWGRVINAANIKAD